MSKNCTKSAFNTHSYHIGKSVFYCQNISMNNKQYLYTITVSNTDRLVWIGKKLNEDLIFKAVDYVSLCKSKSSTQFSRRLRDKGNFNFNR